MAEYKKHGSLENLLLELLLNSLHSEATAIAVRIDTNEKRIMVIDNGCGISKNDLLRLGGRIVENKNPQNCATREEKIWHPEHFLEKLRGISYLFVIMSKQKGSSDTYGKFFGEGQGPELRKLENRPSCGTTVIVYGSTKYFQWNSKIDVSRIRYIVGYLAIVNTQVSFSVRDDTSQCILLRIGKNQKRRKLLSILCEGPLTKGQVKRTKGFILDRIDIEAFWGTKCTPKKIQQIFLNLRPVIWPALQNLMKRIVRKTRHERDDFHWEKLFFLFYIRSPETEYKLSLKGDEAMVEFYENDRIVRGIKKIFTERDSANEKVNYTRFYPPLFLRPSVRTPRPKKNRSFSTNFPKQYFSNGRRSNETKFQTNSSWKKHLSNFLETDDRVHHVMENVHKKTDNDDVVFVVPRTSHLNQQANSTEENMTATSQTSALEPRRDLDESSRNQNCNLLENSLSLSVDTDCIKKLETRPDENQSIPHEESKDSNASNTRSKNRRLNFRALSKTYNNHDISWISQRCAEKSQRSVRTSQVQLEKSPDNTQEKYSIENLSPWSDWSYHSKGKNPKTTLNEPIIYQRFRFLPVHLHALLPHGRVKLTERDPVDSSFEAPLNFHLNLRRQDHQVRACTKRNFEFILKSESLRSMKVLNQVNQEFIVALTKQDEKKLLVIIDQHAMHERIRYENLLRAYRGQLKNEQFVSIALKRPMRISDFPSRDRELLLANRELLMRFGLNLSQRNENILSIHAVPRCFLKRSYDCDNARLETSVRKLLREVVGDLVNGGSKLLPSAINDAIASEACRGSIKFGDPLTPEQCDILVSCWKDTNTPNRCAHGRPSVIPLLELPTYEGKETGHESKVKLNFGSLAKPRGYMGPMGNQKRSVNYEL